MTDVAIIGRPNVGKSTLFNHLIGKKKALIHNSPGVTRDRHIQSVQWIVSGQSYVLKVADTGGLNYVHSHALDHQIREQVHQALEQACVICLVFDGQAGWTIEDEMLVREAQQQGLFQRKKVIACVNKIDTPAHEYLLGEFYKDFYQDVIAVSAEHHRGIEFLKEKIIESGAFQSAQETLENIDPKIAIVGRPNVGKSSIINALIQEKRLIVSPLAGTTMDRIEVPCQVEDKSWVLVDTAGIRRKTKTQQGTEVLSVVQTKKALQDCAIAVLVLDAEEGIVVQDEKVASLLLEEYCNVIIMVNKWDRAKLSQKKALEYIYSRFDYLRFAPVLFVSALQQKGFEPFFSLVEDILSFAGKKISTNAFTNWVRQESKIHNPMNAKFFLCHQTAKNPPRFVLHVNDPQKVNISLKRHLVNAMRKNWQFMGVPIDLQIKKANRRSLPRKQNTARHENKKSC